MTPRWLAKGKVSGAVEPPLEPEPWSWKIFAKCRFPDTKGSSSKAGLESVEAAFPGRW